jgi:hypothetical protein
VTQPTIEELIAAIRRLPLTERMRLIERVAHEASEDTPRPPGVSSLIGLMADEPDVVDEMCANVYQARSRARMRTIDE